jgi:hypothetical protein
MTTDQRNVYVRGPAGRPPTREEALEMARALWDALHEGQTSEERRR